MTTQTVDTEKQKVAPPADDKKEIEVVVGGEPELAVEVVDDTPPQDKGRKPLAKDALADDDEAFNLNEKFKKRLGEVRHQAHDERRAKEQALREREEAITFAKEQMRKARELEQKLSYGEASYAEEMARQAELAKIVAQQKHAKAYEAGDAQAMSEAISDMSKATQQEENAKRWSSEAKKRIENALQQEKNVVDSSQQQSRQQPQTQAPPPDKRALEWAEENNEWFGVDPVMTSTVYGVHEKLVKAGIHPVDDADEYYSAIDAEMQKRFADYEWPAGKSKSSPAAKTKAPPPVAAVSRTPVPSRTKVTLTQTQVRTAEKLGLTLEQYAREVLKLGE